MDSSEDTKYIVLINCRFLWCVVVDCTTAFITLSLPPSLPPQAECLYVGPGNASCVCVEGWTGDGTVCVEINNCLLDSRGGCSPNADCNHIGPGQVSY